MSLYKVERIVLKNIPNLQRIDTGYAFKNYKSKVIENASLLGDLPCFKNIRQTDVIDCEESCLSSLMFMNGMSYCDSLFVEDGLFVEGKWLISVHKNKRCFYERFEYNLETKEIRLSKKDNRFVLKIKPSEQKKFKDWNEHSKYVSVDAYDMNPYSVIDVSDDGMYFEGCCLGDSPFGYGLLYNGSNQLIYRGVMIGDSKECFGIEFYPDSGIVEYCGCYWNNERHGFGMLYDRKGSFIYEGGFLHGSTEYSTSVVLRNIDDDYQDVHSLIRELVIDGEGRDRNTIDRRMDSGDHNDGVDLQFCGFINLERIIVKKNSLKNLNSLKISDNPLLTSIEIENRNDSSISDLGALSTVKSVVISSMMINDWLI